MADTELLIGDLVYNTRAVFDTGVVAGFEHAKGGKSYAVIRWRSGERGLLPVTMLARVHSAQEVAAND